MFGSVPEGRHRCNYFATLVALELGAACALPTERRETFVVDTAGAGAAVSSEPPAGAAGASGQAAATPSRVATTSVTAGSAAAMGGTPASPTSPPRPSQAGAAATRGAGSPAPQVDAGGLSEEQLAALADPLCSFVLSACLTLDPLNLEGCLKQCIAGDAGTSP